MTQIPHTVAQVHSNTIPLGRSTQQTRIISIKIYNVFQDIVDADTIYQICRPFGIIEKIVTFYKNGHGALVQYQNAQDACNTCSVLHRKKGDKEFTLSIRLSSQSHLTVVQDSVRARDYTKGGLTCTTGLTHQPTIGMYLLQDTTKVCWYYMFYEVLV
jgi:hypothetical protein